MGLGSWETGYDKELFRNMRLMLDGVEGLVRLEKSKNDIGKGKASS